MAETVTLPVSGKKVKKQYGTSLEKERDKEVWVDERLKELGFNPHAKGFKEVIPQQKHRKRLEKEFEYFYKDLGTYPGDVYGQHASRKNKSKKGGSVKTSKYSKGGGVRKSKYSL